MAGGRSAGEDAMRALLLSDFGDPNDVITLEETSEPADPTARKLLVEAAAPLHPSDALMARGSIAIAQDVRSRVARGFLSFAGTSSSLRRTSECSTMSGRSSQRDTEIWGSSAWWSARHGQSSTGSRPIGRWASTTWSSATSAATTQRSSTASSSSEERSFASSPVDRGESRRQPISFYKRSLAYCKR
jgi:hypothetical protein